ncbi:discoidin I [Tieghemostelium lacteum]|uniref:Discoidin I n=1 Tax=Tieghemostelium lacteum TaxID=361077 RepID=A0A152A103_TIELA|nr:discoidin I [Tieghemostelium lacteum]|eukprot:KYQ99883.1 discoidin I [Tieghemostelium lacteum]
MNYIITKSNGPPPNSIPVISNGLINITTSSQHSATDSIRGLPLNEPKIEGNSNSLCFLLSDPRKKLIFGSTTIQNFVAFAIRGRGDQPYPQWIQQFILRYTIDGINWLDINGGIHLSGNTDQNTIVTHVFEPPIRALAISFEVLTFSGHPSLRCELYITPIPASIDNIKQTSFLTLNSRHFTVLPEIQNLNSSGVSTSNNNSPNEILFYENTTRIHFGKEFSRIPNINLGITSIQNLPNTHNSKITIQPINITTKDFDIYIKTSIKINSIDIQYTANIN